MPYRRSALTMGVVVDDACYRVAQLAEAKSISLNAASIPKEWQVYGDYEMLLRVFINLLGNAIKFTPAGGQIEVFGDMRAMKAISSQCGIPGRGSIRKRSM